MEAAAIFALVVIICFAFGGGFQYLWVNNDRRGWWWYLAGFGGLGILSLIILT